MERVRRRDVVELVEGFYQEAPVPESNMDQWAGLLCELAAPVLDHGFGVVARLDRLDPPDAMGLHVHSGDAEFKELVEFTSRATRHEALRMYAPNAGISRLTELVGGRLPNAFPDRGVDRLAEKGVNDWITLSATDGSGYLVTIAAALSAEPRALGSNQLWRMVSAHLSAAFRLQRERRDLLGGLRDSAILDAKDHRVVHADGVAKESSALERIREAVRAIDRARVAPDDPEVALRAWKGLVDGTWSAVDRHDHDGRRYIVAVPNEPHIRDPRGLTAREAQVAALASLGQSDKLIAYTLGLARPTVAGHLSRAMVKLGVSSRVELARIFSPLEDEA
ncbi:MAG: helix-turn-helix transcriptional regulator [Myxococcota bacterium]